MNSKAILTCISAHKHSRHQYQENTRQCHFLEQENMNLQKQGFDTSYFYAKSSYSGSQGTHITK